MKTDIPAARMANHDSQPCRALSCSETWGIVASSGTRGGMTGEGVHEERVGLGNHLVGSADCSPHAPIGGMGASAGTDEATPPQVRARGPSA